MLFLVIFIFYGRFLHVLHTLKSFLLMFFFIIFHGKSNKGCTKNTAFYIIIFFSMKRRIFWFFFLFCYLINSPFSRQILCCSLCEQWGADRDDSAGGGEHSGRAHAWRGQTGQSILQYISLIHRIHMFFGSPRYGTISQRFDPDPYPSIIKQK